MSAPVQSTTSTDLTLADLQRRPTLTVEEAGRVLGLARGGAYTAARRGQIPTIRVGRRLVVPSAALLRMLDAVDGQPRQPIGA